METELIKTSDFSDKIKKSFINSRFALDLKSTPANASKAASKLSKLEKVLISKFEITNLLTYISVDFAPIKSEIIGLDLDNPILRITEINLELSYSPDSSFEWRNAGWEGYSKRFLLVKKEKDFFHYKLVYIPSSLPLSDYVSVSYGYGNRIEEFLNEPESLKWILDETDVVHNVAGWCTVLPFSSIWPTIYGSRSAVDKLESTHGRSIVFRERYLPTREEIHPNEVRNLAQKDSPINSPEIIFVTEETWGNGFPSGHYLGQLTENEGSLHMILEVHKDSHLLDPETNEEMEGYLYYVTYIFPETIAKRKINLSKLKS